MRKLLQVAVTAVLLAGVAPAAVITIDATTRGWIRDTGAGNGGSATLNYVAGQCRTTLCSGNAPTELRDYFVFDIPTLSGTVTGLEFLVSAGTVSGSETYQLTSVSSLAFANLGTGTFFGSRNFTTSDTSTFVTITLNNAAIQALVPNSTFQLGGRLTTIDNSTADEFVFGNTGPLFFTQLRITTTDPVSSVPEPGTMWLAGAGLLVAGLRARKIGRS